MAHIDDDNLLHLLDEKIKAGARRTINFNLAKLYTTTSVEVPIIIERAKKPGPCILITAGVHGDEINGVEIVRQLISRKLNRPARGTVICIPVINVFGFINQSRNFPDGRDLNRVFPGTKNGSLASRFAYQFVNEILPVADFCMDFHTGGSARFNASQIRIAEGDSDLLAYAKTFNAPFIVYSKNIVKSYRDTCAKMNKPTLLFEGGKSQVSHKQTVREGVFGVMRMLHHFKMLGASVEVPQAKHASVIIKSSRWIRAKYSGLLHIKCTCGDLIEKGETIATITDPYGTFRHKVKSSNDGYLINVNEAALVYQGDAIFHISVSGKDDEA
ncbi:MAG: succinylglutamate desuccinylase/aspartoacylase family protein [Leeuwenhoekiella sp.]